MKATNAEQLERLGRIEGIHNRYKHERPLHAKAREAIKNYILEIGTMHTKCVGSCDRSCWHLHGEMNRVRRLLSTQQYR